MGPKNIILGDSFSTELPMSRIDETSLMEEKKAAKFSKSAEFQKLKDHLESRIAYYQSFLPDGRPVVSGATPEEWAIANAIIGEFLAVIAAYEQAREVVEEDARRKNS